jgi:DNA-binding HxlR family transcriptional regulator
VAVARERDVVSAGECARVDASLTHAFTLLGRPWNAAVLGALEGGPAGFRELSRGLHGISDSVLSNRLARLCGAGLITRTVDEGPPVSVSYALTDAGFELMPALAQISRWADRHLIK